MRRRYHTRGARATWRRRRRFGVQQNKLGEPNNPRPSLNLTPTSLDPTH